MATEQNNTDGFLNEINSRAIEIAKILSGLSFYKIELVLKATKELISDQPLDFSHLTKA